MFPAMDRLPPLNGIRAFEAAARHMSVTLAADEGTRGIAGPATLEARPSPDLADTPGRRLLPRGDARTRGASRCDAKAQAPRAAQAAEDPCLHDLCDAVAHSSAVRLSRHASG